MNQALYDFLVEWVKKGGQPLSIKTAAAKVGVQLQLSHSNMPNKQGRQTLDSILEEIDRHEHQAGRPLLSAIFIDDIPPPMEVERLPGDRFYAVATELGLYNGSEDKAQKRLFHAEELARVYRQWSVLEVGEGKEKLVNQTLYQHLLKLAKDGTQPTHYERIAQLTAVRLSPPNATSSRGRKTLDGMLNQIDRNEHEAGRPLLSTLVVDRRSHLPGDSFFALASELGLYGGTDDAAQKRLFHIEELARVYRYWVNQK